MPRAKVHDLHTHWWRALEPRTAARLDPGIYQNWLSAPTPVINPKLISQKEIDIQILRLGNEVTMRDKAARFPCNNFTNRGEKQGLQAWFHLNRASLSKGGEKLQQTDISKWQISVFFSCEVVSCRRANSLIREGSPRGYPQKQDKARSQVYHKLPGTLARGSSSP